MTQKQDNPRGARRTRLTRQQKILIGPNKGAVQSLKPVDCKAWMGATVVGVPFDPVQAEINIKAGLCG